MSYKRDFIAFMAEAGVLTFGDFTTKSGRKTPYFINTGNYKTGEQACKLGEFYAACIREKVEEPIDALFGPAYKGIPLAVSTSVALYNQYGQSVNYFFNRKEAKDHGEGGSFVGYMPKDGDRIVITEDVITAGTALRENLPLLKACGDVKISALIVSVDRMEKGKGDKTAIDELKQDFGIVTYPIVTVREIMDTLYNTEVNGKIYIDDAMYKKMEDYLAKYAVQ